MKILSEFTELSGKFKSNLRNAKPWKKEKIDSIVSYIKRKAKVIIITAVAGSTIAGASIGYAYYQGQIITLYNVYIDGEMAGTVDNRAIVDIWKSQELRKVQSQYGTLKIDTKNEITFIEEEKYKGIFDNSQTIAALADKFAVQAMGVKLIVDGQVVGIVKDTYTADKLLEEIKQVYLPQSNKLNSVAAADLKASDQPEIQVESINIKESITTEEVRVAPSEVIDEAIMLELLRNGTLEERKYTVLAGDTISEIAEMFDITTDQIYQMNPSLKGELIHIGDELVVTAMTPLVTVESREKATEIKTIYSQVEYKYDSSMYTNESKVLVSGKNGKKEVEYSVFRENGIVLEKSILNENIVEEPINKVILRGTKVIPTRGSGELAWPAMGGIITSGFGPRWGTFHYGLDISGVSNYTIKAADDGTVVFTGVKGGYGNAVIIDHGNGTETLYAHLKSISVSYGDKVAKGQKIGIMGSTGNSTGVHLHFEIIVNGVKKNPLNYVGQ